MVKTKKSRCVRSGGPIVNVHHAGRVSIIHHNHYYHPVAFAGNQSLPASDSEHSTATTATRSAGWWTASSDENSIHGTIVANPTTIATTLVPALTRLLGKISDDGDSQFVGLLFELLDALRSNPAFFSRTSSGFDARDALSWGLSLHPKDEEVNYLVDPTVVDRLLNGWEGHHHHPSSPQIRGAAVFANVDTSKLERYIDQLMIFSAKKVEEYKTRLLHLPTSSSSLSHEEIVIPNNNNTINIEDCLRKYFSTSSNNHGGSGGGCLPRVLILHIQRFSKSHSHPGDGGSGSSNCKSSCAKDESLVHFPLSNLDFGKILKQDCRQQPPPPMYHCLAVVHRCCNDDDDDGGHFIAFARCEGDGLWRRYHEQTASEIVDDESLIVSQDAFCLFYVQSGNESCKEEKVQQGLPENGGVLWPSIFFYCSAL